MLQSTDPAFTAAEIGDEFDKTRQWADNRLDSMESDGLVQSKNPGARSKFYWITDKGKERLQADNTDS
jgi:DNA-binding MarR family transcriptional regulator